jgi:hypothetical protein
VSPIFVKLSVNISLCGILQSRMERLSKALVWSSSIERQPPLAPIGGPLHDHTRLFSGQTTRRLSTLTGFTRRFRYRLWSFGDPGRWAAPKPSLYLVAKALIQSCHTMVAVELHGNTNLFQGSSKRLCNITCLVVNGFLLKLS